MIDRHAIRQRWEADGSKRDERGRRLFAASEARAAGWGGLAAVSNITGLARSTIERGLKDLNAPPLAGGQVRRKGGGPRPLTETDATLLDDLKRLVEPATLGDPVRPLLWVSKSLDKLASALVAMGHSISPNSVRKLLTEIGFSRQVNRKADGGSGHPDRDAQFEYINAEVLVAQVAGQPVISVDTKKKELVGNYRNAGRTRSSARSRPTACMILPPMRAGSASASRATRPSSRWHLFALGSRESAGRATRRHAS